MAALSARGVGAGPGAVALVVQRMLPFGWRRPGAVERRAARRRRLRAERRTWILGALAAGTSATVAVGEVGRVWSRGSAPLPHETDHVLEAGAEAVREAVAVARAGYEGGSAREQALLNLLGSFTFTFAFVRAGTLYIRHRGEWGPVRNLRFGEQHVHHFVPGIVLTFLSGGAALLTRDEALAPVLALPFGVGAALTLDESALLLKLDDVYWTEEGIVSVQITLAAVAGLSAAVLAAKVLRRGEREVLDDEDGAAARVLAPPGATNGAGL